jgi:protoheme IX farnesyltransferase
MAVAHHNATGRTGIAKVIALTRVFVELTKARLTLLVAATTAVGFLMADGPRDGGAALAWTVLGTALAAAGSMTLNQVLESGRDARMERTRNRPVPSGAIERRTALLFGVLTAFAGLAVLALGATVLTSLLGLAVVLVYALVYTPLKPRTPLCTLAGAVCGAIPPMMGWTASGAPLSFGAWLLAGVLFLWQIPHFLSLAWLYREDYARGGFRMLPVVDPSGRVTGEMAVLYALALVPVGVLAALRTDLVARRLFLATLAYLPLLLGLMVADRVPVHAARLAVAALAAR